MAAINIGMKVIAAVEKERHACETYHHNFIRKRQNPPKLYPFDIMQLNPIELINNHFYDKGDCDILLGGPPCQGFSVHRINNSGVGDPRNRLILRYFEYVTVLKPKAFIMENVPGILWERHKDYLEGFYSYGENTGYRIFKPLTLDARDYGVPQRRKRVFILGLRQDIEFNQENWKPEPTHGDEKERIKSPHLKPWRTASEVFEKMDDENDENNVHMNHTQMLIEVFKSTPPNGGSRHQSNRVLPCHVKHNGHKDVYGRIDPAKPGPTMTTACVNPSRGRFLHPTEHHGITVRQAARFQTFPEKFIFRGGLMASGTQVGNAVPIVMGEIILDTIASILISDKR